MVWVQHINDTQGAGFSQGIHWPDQRRTNGRGEVPQDSAGTAVDQPHPPPLALQGR